VKRFKATPARSAWDYFLPGHTAEERGDLEEAMRSYRAALTMEPNHYISLNCLAGCLATDKINRRPEAIQLFTGCIALRPHTVNPYHARANCYRKLGQLDEAEADHSAAISAAASEWSRIYAYDCRRSFYRDLGRTEKARQDQARIIELWEQMREKPQIAPYPEGYRQLILMGNVACVYQDAGRLQEAVALLEQTLEKCKARPPDLADAYYFSFTLGRTEHLADAYKKAGRLREAIALDEQVLEKRKATLGPDHPDTLRIMNNLALAYSEAGRSQEAIRLLKQRMEKQKGTILDPSQAVDHFNLGYALWKKGALDEAIAALKEAIRLKADFALAYSGLGVALADKGALDEAIAAHNKAIRLKPDVALAYHNLGIALFRKGALDEAIAAYNQAIRLKPDEADFHGGLAIASCEKGAHDEALAAIRNALRLDPGKSHFHKDLGIILLEKGAWDEAITACEEAIRLQPDNDIAHETLGRAFQGKGALKEAVAAKKECILLQPKSWRYHNSLGVAYLRMDALDEATACYREGLRLAPDSCATLGNLGSVLMEKGAWGEADAVLERAVRISEKQAKGRPTARTRLDWAITVLKRGTLHREMARYQEAEKELRQAQAILEKLLSESPKDHVCLRCLADALGAQAKLCRDRDELAEARRLLGEALGRQQTALKLFVTSPLYQGLVAVRSLELADTLLQLSEPAAVKDQVEQLLREAVRYSANDRSAQNALAWFLATCRRQQFRDPKRAVELAKRLVEQAPQKGAYWRTLGAALFGMGDWKGTVAAMEQATKAFNGGDGTERFFLAMACWRMGNREQARAGYDQAVKWMEKHRPRHAELRRLRAEAASLLNTKEHK
jgi:tetratricopeptide (TPR) repeat protein